jgi:hypothetical protein
MRYLKYFEGISEEDIQTHILEIKDIFQEYIDDYDIYQLDTSVNTHISGLYYTLDWNATNYKSKKIYFIFTIYIIEEEDAISVSNKFLKLHKEKESIISNLKSIGYDCLIKVPFMKSSYMMMDIENSEEFQFHISCNF